MNPLIDVSALFKSCVSLCNEVGEWAMERGDCGGSVGIVDELIRIKATLIARVSSGGDEGMVWSSSCAPA